jgi:hypothetical protein
MLDAIWENVAALKKQGRSRDETVAAKPTAAFDAKWGNFVIDPGFFTRLVYEGVKSRTPSPVRLLEHLDSRELPMSRWFY